MENMHTDVREKRVKADFYYGTRFGKIHCDGFRPAKESSKKKHN